MAKIAAVLVGVLLAACAPSVAPSAPPTAETPPPTAASLDDCWVTARAVYSVAVDGGGSPTDRELEAVRQIVAGRLDAADVAQTDVRGEPPDRLIVRVGQIERIDDIRSLVAIRGGVDFVPVPRDQLVEDGERVNAAWRPLFGREGVARARRIIDNMGQDAIEVTLTPNASDVLDQWAAGNVGSQLAITLDGVVLSAPMVEAPRFGGQLILSGPADEHAMLVALLSQPTLPVILTEIEFSPVSEPSGCAARSVRIRVTREVPPR